MNDHATIPWGAFVGALLSSFVIGLSVLAVVGWTTLSDMDPNAWFYLPFLIGFVGGPIYLLFGVPWLVIAMNRAKLTMLRATLIGLCCNITLGIIALAVVVLLFGGDHDSILFVFGIGCFVAPLWTGTFAIAYRVLETKPHR